jgi:hypothetical protein
LTPEHVEGGADDREVAVTDVTEVADRRQILHDVGWIPAEK